MKQETVTKAAKGGKYVESEDEAHLREQQEVLEYMNAQKAKLIAERSPEAGKPGQEVQDERMEKKLGKAELAPPTEIDPEMEAEMLREQEQMVALLAKERDRRAKSRAADDAFSHLLQQPLIQLLDGEERSSRPASVARTDSRKSNGSQAFSESKGSLQLQDETWGDKAPAGLVCPLTLELMVDPVSTCDGQSYERREIEEWLRENDTSPLTNKKLENKTLTPNIALRRTIEEWNTTRAQRLLAQVPVPESGMSGLSKDSSLSAVPRGAMEISVFSPVKTFSDHESAPKSIPKKSEILAAEQNLPELPADKLGFA